MHVFYLVSKTFFHKIIILSKFSTKSNIFSSFTLFKFQHIEAFFQVYGPCEREEKYRCRLTFSDRIKWGPRGLKNICSIACAVRLKECSISKRGNKFCKGNWVKNLNKITIFFLIHHWTSIFEVISKNINGCWKWQIWPNINLPREECPNLVISLVLPTCKIIKYRFNYFLICIN